MSWRMDAMIRKCPCLRPEVEEVRVLDFKHCSLADVPNEIFNFERTLEELYLDANQIHDLPRPLFHCHELRVLGLSDNDVHSLPQAIASLINLEELDISKNGVLDIPDNIKGCKCLRILEASVNPLGKLPDGFTQLINLEELYLNDTFVDFLPANFGRLTKLRVLELRENHLKSLPKSMARLTELTRLDIGQNDFREMPDVIGSLPKLTEFWCDCNRISSVPPFVGNLRRLTYLELSRNRIERLPNEIEKCVNLTDITLSSNSLKTLPESIGCLINLSILRVDDNRLQRLPNSIGCLSNLEEFVLSQNDLKCLPASIGLLRKMHTFIIDDNLLEYLPPEVGSCASLTILSARSNRLTRIPDELGHILRLRIVNLSDNRITFLPFSITKLRNLQALWLSENQNKPLIPLQSDIDIDTGQRVLTCFILPQVHQRPCEEPSDNESLRLSVWEEQRPQRQHIKFAPDEKLDKPGKLTRNPTPYPKELKAHAKHARNNQAIKTKSANYANIDSLHDDESNPNNDGEATVVQETAIWMPSMPVTVKEARVTKPMSPRLSPKLHEQPLAKRSDEESIYGKHSKKQLGKTNASCDLSSTDVSDSSRERSNSVRDFPDATSTVNRAIGSPVTVGKFASLPELSSPQQQLPATAQIRKPTAGAGGRGGAPVTKEPKHQRSYSSGILRKLESLKQGRHHKYEGLKNAASNSRSDQDLYHNLREVQCDPSGREVSSMVAPSSAADGYSSDWEAVVARRYGNTGNAASMIFGQAKRPASISAAHTRPVTGGGSQWQTAAANAAATSNRSQLVGSYSRLLGGSPRSERAKFSTPVSTEDPEKIYRSNYGLRGRESIMESPQSPRPPPDVLPRSSGQGEPPIAGGIPLPPSAALPGRFPGPRPGWLSPPGPSLPPKCVPDPPSLPPRSKPLPVPSPPIGSPDGVSPLPQFYSQRHPSGAGTVPPSPNRNRKPPPYHIAATYSRQIGDPLLTSQSTEVVGHPYARPPSGPPSPRGSMLPVSRYSASTNSSPSANGYTHHANNHYHHLGRSTTPPFPNSRSTTPPFPLVHPVNQSFSAAGQSRPQPPSPQTDSPPISAAGGGSPRSVVHGAVIYNNPYINEQQPRPTSSSANRSPSPAAHSPAGSSGSHRSGRSSSGGGVGGDRGSIKSRKSSSSTSSLHHGQQSPHHHPHQQHQYQQQDQTIYARRMSPKVMTSSPAGTPRSSASSTSSETGIRSPLRPLAPLNITGGPLLPRSLSAPSTPPLHQCPPSPPAPPYRTPPLYQSLSIGNLDAIRPSPSYHHATESPTATLDIDRSTNGSPPNLLKKCRISREQQRVSPSTNNHHHRKSESPSAIPRTNYSMGSTVFYDRTNQMGARTPSAGSNGSYSPDDKFRPQQSPGHSSRWMHSGVEVGCVGETRTPELADPSHYGIFTAQPILVESSGSRDEASASDYDGDSVVRHKSVGLASSAPYAQEPRGGSTVYTNPYVVAGNPPPNLTQNKLGGRGVALVTPTPHRPVTALPAVVVPASPTTASPFLPSMSNQSAAGVQHHRDEMGENGSAGTYQATLPSPSAFDKGYADRQVVLLKKQSPWLFGQHRNPKVIPVVIQKNPDLGFSITQFQNGASQPFESAVCVASVTPEGAASTVLKPGDKLLQVDGKDISRLDLLQARRVLQDTGPTVFMMVSR